MSFLSAETSSIWYIVKKKKDIWNKLILRILIFYNINSNNVNDDEDKDNKNSNYLLHALTIVSIYRWI